MSDELKSALDLALEKLDREIGPQLPSLSEIQKKQIAEIRSKYRAKIAQAEISAQSDLKKVAQTGDPAAIDEVRQRLAREKTRFESEMERAVQKVRDEKGA